MAAYMVSYEHDRLGDLVKMDDGCYSYDPVTDSWRRWKYGDAMAWGQGPFMDYDDVSGEEAMLIKYRLQVAQCLSHMYGASFRLRETREERMIEWAKYVQEAFECGDSPEDTAIEIGYSCG